MRTIAENLKRISQTIPEGVQLVAVSKYRSREELLEAYDAGQRVFAENRPLELNAKASTLPEDICWHFIGHLQTNKLRYVLPYCSMIHSIDSERLMDAVEKWAAAAGKMVNVLLEVHIGREETKQGFSGEETVDLARRVNAARSESKCDAGSGCDAEGKSDAESGRGAESKVVSKCDARSENCGQKLWPHLRICGLMGMASHSDDEGLIENDFSRIEALWNEIKLSCPNLKEFKELSIGMSGDYLIALRHGATMVRIGSAIFDREQG